jgi:hypothetical protein
MAWGVWLLCLTGFPESLPTEVQRYRDVYSFSLVGAGEEGAIDRPWSLRPVCVAESVTSHYQNLPIPERL